MHILIATPLYPPEVGGPATYTKELESRLPERGFTVSVLPFGQFKRYPYIIRHFAFFVAVWRKMGACDAVYAQDPLGVGLPAIFAARLRFKKAFLRIAGDRAWETGVQKFGVTDDLDTFAARWTFNPVLWILKIAQWKATLFAHHIIVPSNYFNRIVVSWGVPQKKVQTIYNGIDLQAVPQCAPHETPTKTIISAGRLVPWKGFDALISLMERMPDWRLLIAGDGPEKANLQQTANNRELQDRVLFLGNLSREVLFKNMCQADAFVLNTSFESFSFQIVEAMAAGVPVVTTHIGSIPELIVHEKEGMLVEPNDIEGIRHALNTLQTSSDLREQMVENARKKAAVFSIESSMDQLSQTLTRICKS